MDATTALFCSTAATYVIVCIFALMAVYGESFARTIILAIVYSFMAFLWLMKMMGRGMKTLYHKWIKFWNKTFPEVIDNEPSKEANCLTDPYDPNQ